LSGALRRWVKKFTLTVILVRAACITKAMLKVAVATVINWWVEKLEEALKGRACMKVFILLNWAYRFRWG